MSIKLTIKGLDNAQHQLADLQKFTSEVNGALRNIKANASQPESIERAIHEAESLVNARATEFKDNPLIVKIAGEIKGKYREALLKKVAEIKP